MGGRRVRSHSSRAVALPVVGLLCFAAAACGSDDDDGGDGALGSTTAGSPATSTEPVIETTAPTTAPPATTIEPTPTTVATTSTTTTTTTTTTSTTTTAPTPVLPTWSMPMVLDGDGAGGDSPLTGLGRRARFRSSDLGMVAVRPNSVEAAEAETHTWFSVDGLNWESTGSIEGERLDSVVAGGPGFIAAGAADSDLPGLATPLGVLPRPIPTIRTSSDGRVWNRAVIDSAPFEHGEIDDVAVAGAGGLVAVGEVWDGDRLRGPAVWTSSDGLAWTLQPGDPLGTSDEPLSLTVAAGAGGVVVVALETPLESDGPGPLAAWWSADGAAWERVPGLLSFTDGSRPAGVVPFGDGFVMVGSRGARVALVWTSPDGRSWTEPAELPVRPVTDSTLVFGLATDGSVLIAYGDDVVFGEGTDPAIGDVAIWMSLDAVTWEQVPPESLRGAEPSDQPSPVALVDADGEWILLGSAADLDTDTAVGVAWFGRVPM